MRPCQHQYVGASWFFRLTRIQMELEVLWGDDYRSAPLHPSAYHYLASGLFSRSSVVSSWCWCRSPPRRSCCFPFRPYSFKPFPPGLSRFSPNQPGLERSRPITNQLFILPRSGINPSPTQLFSAQPPPRNLPRLLVVERNYDKRAGELYDTAAQRREVAAATRSMEAATT